MTPLTDPDRIRLGAMLALAERDQNPSDPERLAAIAAVERLLAKWSLRLRDLAESHAADRSRSAERPDDDPLWRGTVRECLDRSMHLTSWELGFLRSLTGFRRPTEKQQRILAEIAERLGVKAAW